jgi:hypothetical protein
MAILISGLDITPRPAFIEIKDYVPLSFRSYESMLGGVRDVRLGGLSSSFLELTLGLESNVLRGFTLLSFDTIHEPKAFDFMVEREGLPVLALNSVVFSGRIGTQYCNLPMLFSVGFGIDFIELRFDELLNTAERSIACGQVKFYINENSLLGIRVHGLRQEQITSIKSMVAVDGSAGSSTPNDAKISTPGSN